MTQLIRSLSTFLVGTLFFVGLLFGSPTALRAMAAVTPDAAKQVIEEARSPQEAAQNLKALDSSDILKNHGTIDPTRDVLKTPAQDRVTDRVKREPLASRVEEKFKETAETVKEKLNLDEPIPESTKKFGRQITGRANRVEDNLGKATDTVTGKSQQVVDDLAQRSKAAISESKEAAKSNSRDIATSTKSGYYQTER